MYTFRSGKMGRSRKEVEDTTTPEGKIALSNLRNRAADRVVDIVKDYQSKSKHKVLLNFIPTWENGKPRVWLSHENITPMRVSRDGKRFVPITLQKGELEDHEEGALAERAEEPESEPEAPSGSQRMTRRAAATPGTKNTKKDLKIVCGHCSTGRNHGDLHPQSAWLKCGEKMCRSINFNFHAKCHGIKINKGEEKQFNRNYMRCPEHNGKKSVLETDGEVSDDDFLPTKKGPKAKEEKEKLKPTKVYTPGAKNLPPLKKKNIPDIVDVGDSDEGKSSPIKDPEDSEKGENSYDHNFVGIESPIFSSKTSLPRAGYSPGRMSEGSSSSAESPKPSASTKLSSPVAGKYSAAVARKTAMDKAGKSSTAGATKTATDLAGKSSPAGSTKTNTDKAGKSSPAGATKTATDLAGKSSPAGSTKTNTDKTGKSSLAGSTKTATDLAAKSSPAGSIKTNTDKTGKSSLAGSTKTATDKTGKSSPAGSTKTNTDKTGKSSLAGAKKTATDKAGKSSTAFPKKSPEAVARKSPQAVNGKSVKLATKEPPSTTAFNLNEKGDVSTPSAKKKSKLSRK